MPRDRHAISGIKIFRRILRAGGATIGWIIAGLIFTGSLRAQEPIRTAAPAPLIASYRRAPDAFFYWGPFQEIMTGTFRTEYTDNVNLTPTDKISNLSFSLGMNLDTTWVISHLNQLTLNVGGEVTENFYGNGRNQLTVSIAPNSLLEFKFAISDWQFRLFDQFSYIQNPTSSPTATNTANLNSFTNTIGASAETNLNIALFTLTTDYTYNSQTGQNSQGQDNAGQSGTRESFRVSPSLTFRLTPTILYGINAAATRSTGEHSANVNSLNFGPFINGKLEKHLEFDLSGGGTLVSTKPSIPPTYYFTGAIRFDINRHWQILVSGSHELVFTTGTDLTQQNLIRLGTSLDITRTIAFNLAPFINFGNVETSAANSSVATGPYTQLGVEVALTWHPRKRWSSALTYNYTRRESGSTGPLAQADNYIQNTLSLSVRYAF